ncbi:uncharacterized protein LOC122258904 [Penaeus japonicus]|uniref:uncharacterized protein LOC122258904 n=1 Tax=Penaeus japonicus TaxID=27405 RepID=UPI001C70C89D|nr:uncharacterized protein LOC122258904 [Penaeus japonicus]
MAVGSIYSGVLFGWQSDLGSRTHRCCEFLKYWDPEKNKHEARDASGPHSCDECQCQKTWRLHSSALLPVMWKVLLLALPFALESLRAAGSSDVTGQETVNAEEIRYKHLLFQIHDVVRKLLFEKEKRFNQSLDALTQVVETACRPDPNDQKSESTNLAKFEQSLEKMNSVFSSRLSATQMEIAEDVQATLSEWTNDTVKNLTLQFSGLANKNDLSAMQSHVSTLVTSNDLNDLQKNLSSFVSTAADGIKQSTRNLTAITDARDQYNATSNQIIEIKELLDNVTSCNYRNYFDQVMAMLTTAEEDIGDLAEIFSASQAEQKDTCVSTETHRQRTDILAQQLQGLQASVDNNANSIHSVASSVGEVKTKVATRLVALEELAEEISNNTVQPRCPPTRAPAASTTPRPATETTASLPAARTFSPCLDSSLAGKASDENICQTAVLLQKCQLLAVAYHCCRSCTDAGMIPVMGPHRRVNYSRRLSRITAAQLMRP